jgi:alpha-beta hydrolase superfamily lysophospholipase
MTATPVYFGAPERPLFGLYHAPEGPARGAGAVWCPPFGQERARCYRALRHLAERLAAAGLAVLRFDPHGTGDSSGDDGDPGRLAAWLAGVGAAVAELRARSGAARVVIGGLRLGATLAALAAARSGGADAIVLWSPWITGEGFLRDASRMERLRRALEGAGAGASGGERPDRESCGFLITPETALDLRGLDLLALEAAPAPRALVVGTGEVAEEGALVARLAALGAEARHEAIPGQAFLRDDPHRSELPREALDAITAWIDRSFPPLGRDEARSSPPPPSSDGAQPASAAPLLGERALSFGAPHRLFGILHDPDEGARRAGRAARPCVVITGAGAVDHTGPCRMSVRHARALARRGFAVLRFDLPGIGESPAREGCEERLAYPPSAPDDVRAAMDAAGAETFVLAGLCSGADIALRVAMHDRRVGGLVLMNPIFLAYRDLEEIRAFHDAGQYRRALLRPGSWGKLLRGEVDVRHAAQVMSSRAKRSALQGAASLLGRPAGALGAIRGVVERGVDVLLVFAEEEPGLAYLEEQPAAFAALRALPGLRMEVVPGDHTFTSIRCQEAVRALVVDHVARRHA